MTSYGLAPTATLEIVDRTAFPTAPETPIQSADDVVQSVKSFVMRSSDASANDGLSFKATVQGAASSDGGGDTLAVQVRGITLEEAKKFGDIIRLDAGYIGTANVAPQSIFYGQVQSILPKKNAGEVVFDISATSKPAELLELFIPASAASIPADSALKLLAAGAGLQFEIPTREGGYPTLTNWHTQDTLGEEITKIVRLMSDELETDFAVLHRSEDPFSMRLLDLTEDSGIDVLVLNLDAPSIWQVTPINESSGSYSGSSDPASFNPFIASSLSIAMAFDPRVYAGLTVAFESEFYGNGTIVVTEYTHELASSTEFTTTLKGTLKESNFFNIQSASTETPILDEDTDAL